MNWPRVNYKEILIPDDTIQNREFCKFLESRVVIIPGPTCDGGDHTMITLGRSWHCWISAWPWQTCPGTITNCSSHFNPHSILHNIMNILACLSKHNLTYFSCFRSGYCNLCCQSTWQERWRMTSCLQSRDNSTKFTSGNTKMSGTHCDSLYHFLYLSG